MSALVQEKRERAVKTGPPTEKDGGREVWESAVICLPLLLLTRFPLSSIPPFPPRPLPAAPSDATLQSKSAITVRRACSVSRVDTGVFTI